MLSHDFIFFSLQLCLERKGTEHVCTAGTCCACAWGRRARATEVAPPSGRRLPSPGPRASDRGDATPAGAPTQQGLGGEHGAPRVTRSPKGQSRRGDGLNPLTQTIARLEARWPVRCPCRLKDTPRGPSHGDFHGPSLPLVPARPREAPSPPPGRAGPGPPPWAKRSLLLKVSEPWSLRPLPRLTPHRLGSPTTFSSLLTKATPVTGRPAGAGTHPGAQVE